MTNKTKNRLLLGIVGAALAGVAVGLLFYTDEGNKVRRKMKKKAGDLSHTVNDWIANGKEQLSHLTHKAADKANDVADKAYRKAKQEL